VQGRLPEQLEAEKQHLFANILLRQGHFEEAAALLANWKGPADWMAYAQFNLGVAYVRNNKLAQADPFLEKVGTINTARPELLALKDRANLALGFAHLQANDPRPALTALERVRLNGPYSNKALLGTGWARAALGEYQEALNPWLELQGRDMLDAAVQESYLAVPYAFGKLQAASQSAEYYEQAVTSFDSEGVKLDQAIGRIQGGNMLDTLLGSDEDTHFGWFWQLRNLPDAPESRYLYTVLAGHDFQEGLKNYRDLVYMAHTLDKWGDSMEAFGDMIDTRERAYAERLPRVDALLASGAVEKLAQRKGDLESRVNAIDGDKDVAALGSPEEREQWARVQRVEAALAAAPDDQERADLKERLRLVKGVLYFRLNDSFRARMWQQRRTIKDLDLALHEAQNRWIRVERARQSVPTNNGEFAARVAALKARMDGLQAHLAATEQKQSEYLGQVAVAELEQQKDRLSTYQVQARFALATMYDRAANPEPQKKEPAQAPAPEQPPGNDTPAPQSATPGPGDTAQPAPGDAPAPQPQPGGDTPPPGPKP